MADIVPVKKDAPDDTRVQMTNSEMAKMISNAVAEALKVAIPAAAVGISNAQTLAANTTQEKRIREAMKKVQRCPICLLPVSACGGAFKADSDGNPIIKLDDNGGQIYEPSVNHIKYFCGPKEDSLFKWFQGVIINGVRFLADYQGHVQWIPKKSDIPTIISNWEKNEKELSQKRQAEGNGSTNRSIGGSMGGNGQAIGWR